MDAGPSGRDDRRFEWQVVLDAADYRAMANAYARQRRRERKGQYLTWRGLVAWLALTILIAAVLNLIDSDVSAAALAGFGAGILALCIALLVYNRLAMPKLIQKLGGTQGKTFSVVIDSTGITSQVDMDTVKFSWAGMKATDETDTHYFMWPNSLYGLVLPKRVLRDADENTRFAEALKDWSGGK